jgi:hypothetical protein
VDVGRTIARSRAPFASTACLLLWVEQHGPRAAALVPGGYAIPDVRYAITLPLLHARPTCGMASLFATPRRGFSPGDVA